MVAVVTDSAASLPSELAAELGIAVVPIYLSLGGRSFADEADPGPFYERLRREPGVATTASPSPGDFVEAFDRAPGDEVVCVTVSSEVSALHRTATVAAGMSAKRVEVLDSGTASMAEGFVAMEAARAAARGAPMDEVVARARTVSHAARLVAAIDTFEHLRRSGRVGWIASSAGAAFRIKPVFRFSGGRIERVAQPRTRRRALDRLVAEAERDIAGRPVHLAAVHAEAESDARTVLDRVAAGLDVVEAHVAGFTAAMGAHTGPGVVGLAYFCD